MVDPLPQVPTAADAAVDAPAPVQPPLLPPVGDVDIAEWQPPVTAVAVPAAPPAQPSEMTEEQYHSLVKRKIVDRIGNNYPPRAKKRNLEGRVVASIAIGADGQIVALEIVQSSGHRILDRFVIREVKAAAPFASPPEGPVTVIVPVRFRLQ